MNNNINKINNKWIDKISETYYKDQMDLLLPIDKYGIQFKMMSTNGKTKWLNLNKKSLKTLTNMFKGVYHGK